MPTTREKREKRESRYSDAKKRADEHQSGGFSRTAIALPKGMKAFSIKKPGIYRVDILPYVVKKGAGNPFAEAGFMHYERTYFCHRDVGPNRDMYLCLAKTWKEKCPICEQRLILGDDEDADTALLKNMKWKERQLFNVIDLKAPEEGVQLWDISYYLFGELLDTNISNADEGDNYDGFFHYEDGLSLKLTAAEKSIGQGKPFCEIAAIEFKPREQQYDEAEMLEKVANLDDLLIKPDYAALKRLFLQLEDGDDAEEAEAPKAVRNGKAQRPAARKPVADDAPAAKPAKKPATAASKGIVEGDKVTYKKTEYEVDRVSKDGTSLTLIDDEGEELTGVGVADVVKVEEDWAEDAAPAKPAAKPKGKPAKAAEPDDDEWEEDEMEDDDSEEEAKAKPRAAAAKTGGKKPAAVEEDDDDAWEDD